jgi:hypothetical protein
MYVDRRKILIGNIGTGGTIDIPLGTNFFPEDNSELIEHKFVEDEKEKAINPIVDHKKIIFRPADNNWDIITKYKINLNFYTPDTIANGSPQYRDHLTGANGPGVYADIGFVFDDLFCRTERFINSFLRLIFYDRPISGENKVLFFSDIYTQVEEAQENPFGFVLPVDEAPISMIVGDPVLQPDLIHEGYNIYWYKDLVDEAPNQEYEMWVAAVFNNAGNGKSIPVSSSKMADPNNILITDLEDTDGALYLKVVLKNDNGVYKYRFEGNSKQIPTNGGVNLNPTSGDLSSITFWQITV